MEHFHSKGRTHPYIARKSDESLDMSEFTFHADKSVCYQLQQQTKVHGLALAWQTILETAQKALNKGCSTLNELIPRALHHQTSECK